ncbi:RodZ domain-containing protein [Tumidithrix elongata RA019]|uniref:RodZ domain-containing protein n=1 Tax=Tumidithrix elongata BACA0141 TaxID=2716417 RepID=A0AAW9PWK4_9CYAN|nr:RodZ domain-containing protein [Tumidithrix elongata RA019]
MVSNCNQADKLAEIGAQLKQMREQKDISLQQVTATTLIAERHLRAIEEGDLGSLPEPVYIKGFIRKYGETVGLGTIADDFHLTPVIDEKKNWSKSPASELRPLHLYALYILVIGGAVGTLAAFLNPPLANKIDDSKTNLSKAAQITPKATPKTVKPTPAIASPVDSIIPVTTASEALKTSKLFTSSPDSSSSSNPNGASFLTGSTGETLSASSPQSFSNSIFSQDLTNTSFSFTGNKAVNVGIVMTGQSWVRVLVDGKTEFEGVLSEGRKLSWSADRRVAIRAGNAGAIAVTVNNLPSEQLGREGEVVEKRFEQNYKPTTSSTSLVPTTGANANTANERDRLNGFIDNFYGDGGSRNR